MRLLGRPNTCLAVRDICLGGPGGPCVEGFTLVLVMQTAASVLGAAVSKVRG